MNSVLFILLMFAQTINIAPQSEAKIKIHTTKEESYIVLTKNQPLEIKASGPTWIRVYTRIPWYGEKKGTRVYKLILQEDDINEKFVTQETEYSSIARLENIRLSKWRSFYINVPAGLHTYRLIFWRAPVDTILLKFTNESPGKWQDITPLSYNSKLELVEDEKILNYYELIADKPVILEIEGPKKVKVISRLNIATSLQGEEIYSITVKEKNKVRKSTSFRAYSSQTCYYKNRSDIVPSNPHTMFINIPKGIHRYEFVVDNNNSCGLRFMVEVK